MESVVELEINVGQARVAELFADPRNNPLWMDDVERIESITGDLGQPGSTYRLVPKRGPFTFIATVVLRDLPNKLGLTLDASGVSVVVQATLVRLSESRTKLGAYSVRSLGYSRDVQSGLLIAITWKLQVLC